MKRQGELLPHVNAVVSLFMGPVHAGKCEVNRKKADGNRDRLSSEETMKKTEQPDISLQQLKDHVHEFSALAERLNTIEENEGVTLSPEKDLPSRLKRDARRSILWDKINEKFQYGAKTRDKGNVFEDVLRLIRLTHDSYEQFKGIFEGRYSTHKFITQEALKLTGLTDPAVTSRILEYCVFPDKTDSDLADLIYEGHFYGKTQSGKTGNFIVTMFPKAVNVLEIYKKLHKGPDEDIHEHAVSNFRDNLRNALGSEEKKYYYLGIAAHYVQDLTAPHHVGNYPAVPYVDHYLFEKFASVYVHSHPEFSITKAGYEDHKTRNTLNKDDPEGFCEGIYEQSSKYIGCIASELHSKSIGSKDYATMLDKMIDEYASPVKSDVHLNWKEAVNGAVPIAVYATANLLETVLQL
jgi:hypothetical protein